MPDCKFDETVCFHREVLRFAGRIVTGQRVCKRVSESSQLRHGFRRISEPPRVPILRLCKTTVLDQIADSMADYVRSGLSAEIETIDQQSRRRNLWNNRSAP